MKEQFKFVFVIVTYKNSEDIIDFFESTKKFNMNSKYIIVNNYFDEKSERDIYEISLKYEADFINVPNEGYGKGNNIGILHANENYKFEYLVVTNPDIDIKTLDEKYLSNKDNCVIGPLIKTKMGKNQNPYWKYNNPLCEFFIYIGYKKSNDFILYSAIIINKILRELSLLKFKLFKKDEMEVFALHGSFLIFPKQVLDKIGKPYDEDMFLFAEEAHLAHILKKNNVKSIITKKIKVLHKEDGSMSSISINTKNEIKKSVLTYYEKIKKGG